MMRRNVTRTEVQTAVDRLHKLSSGLRRDAAEWVACGDYQEADLLTGVADAIDSILATLEEQ